MQYKKTPPVLITSLFLTVFATPAFSDAIDNYIQCKMKKNTMPGLSLAIVKNGQTVKAKGYGFSNVELEVPAKPETIYQSGSIGKQFTAMLTMILIEKGLLHLNDRLSDYISETPESWKDIRIFHLLTHTSGLTRDIPNVDWRINYSQKELIQRLEPYPLDSEPGSAFSYSNAGYVLLGFVLEKVAGKPYGLLLEEKVFVPLNMHTARLINDRDLIPNRAAGYDLVNGKIKNQEPVSSTFNSTADGALYFTVLDLSKWDAALYTEKLLKKENMELLWAPVKLTNGKTSNYSLGWELPTVNGHQVMEHLGGWQGFTSFITRYPHEKLTVIIMTNLSGNGDIQPMAHKIASLYMGTNKTTSSDDDCDKAS